MNVIQPSVLIAGVIQYAVWFQHRFYLARYLVSAEYYRYFHLRAFASWAKSSADLGTANQ